MCSMLHTTMYVAGSCWVPYPKAASRHQPSDKALALAMLLHGIAWHGVILACHGMPWKGMASQGMA